MNISNRNPQERDVAAAYVASLYIAAPFQAQGRYVIRTDNVVVVIIDNREYTITVQAGEKR